MVWINERKIKESLKELIVVDKIKRRLSVEMKEHSDYIPQIKDVDTLVSKRRLWNDET